MMVACTIRIPGYPGPKRLQKNPARKIRDPKPTHCKITWDVKKPCCFYGINYQPQLVSRGFFHQAYLFDNKNHRNNVPSGKSDIAMENGPFEDVFRIYNDGDVSLPEGTMRFSPWHLNFKLCDPWPFWDGIFIWVPVSSNIWIASPSTKSLHILDHV